jgi:hypothetical protein
MRKFPILAMLRFLVLAMLLVFSILTPCHAMQISTDRQTYSPLEEGVLSISLNVPLEYQKVIIEIEIFDEKGNLVYGDIMHSEIPEYLFSQPVTESYTNISWQEVPVDGKVTRDFPFTIPATASDGDYTIVSRVLYQDNTVDYGSASIFVVGSLPAIEGFEIIFIVALIVAIMIWKEV